MSILVSTLKEELATSKKLEKKYSYELALLPKGSFIVRKVGKKQYGYLTYRNKNKVEQKYLGPLSEKQIEEYREKSKKKRVYKKQLKQIKEQLIILMRALRGKTK